MILKLLAESMGEKLGFIKVHEHHNNYSTPNTDDLSAAEDKTVASAVRTDAIHPKTQQQLL
jgi:hypothetical protein